MRRRLWWNIDSDRSDFLGFGQTHDLRDADSDPRNPHLIGLKSVSYAAAVAMKRPEPVARARKIGFDTTAHRKRGR